MHRWEDNTKMYLKELECEVVDWIYPIQDRVQLRGLVNTKMYLRVL